MFGFDLLDNTLPILEPLLAGLSCPGRALLRHTISAAGGKSDGRTFAAYLAARDGAYAR